MNGTSPLTLVLALALSGCPPAPKATGTAGAAPLQGELRRREPTRVRTSALRRGEMVRTLSTATTVESEYEIEVFARVAGFVTEIAVEEGDRVQQGQRLATLDKREVQAALDDAKMALRESEETAPLLTLATREAEERYLRAQLTQEQASRDYERNAKAGLISTQDLDRLALARDQALRDAAAAKIAWDRAIADQEAQATAVARAELTVARAELDLSFCEILAPFPGVIATRSIKVGDSISGSASAFVLTDPDRLRAVFHRPQRELPLFRKAAQKGSPANGDAHEDIEIRVAAEAIPGHEFEGRIELVSPTIDAASGSFRVTVRLEQPAEEGGVPRLLPGMLVRLSVVTERHPDALIIQKRALRREGEALFLFKVEEGLARKVDVREGFSSDEEVEVLPVEEGTLAAGDRIVVVGNRDLDEDAEVLAEPWEAEADQGAASQ